VYAKYASPSSLANLRSSGLHTTFAASSAISLTLGKLHKCASPALSRTSSPIPDCHGKVAFYFHLYYAYYDTHIEVEISVTLKGLGTIWCFSCIRPVFKIEGFTANHKHFCPSKNTSAKIALHNEIQK
jgi:hypothetical protein